MSIGTPYYQEGSTVVCSEVYKVPYDRVFALHTLRNMAQERNDARLVRNPALHAYRGQSGLLGRTVRYISRFWTESFVPPDSPVCLGRQSGTPGQSGLLHRTVRCIFGFETEGQTCLHIGHLMSLERSNIAMLLGWSGVVRSSENPLKMIVKMLTHMHIVVFTWWCWHICKG